ncbi:MAG TPA: hypothetical protein VFI64_00740 [Nitrososphaeraceae archaeon]|nr:hypothetical protein [Nitrososphaeraceae archaeon]
MKAKQDIIFSGEAYRYFVNSARSVSTKNSYTKALWLYMKFKCLTDREQLLTGELKPIQSNIIELLIHLKEVQNLSYASISLYCTASPFLLHSILLFPSVGYKTPMGLFVARRNSPPESAALLLERVPIMISCIVFMK